LTPLFNYFIRE